MQEIRIKDVKLQKKGLLNIIYLNFKIPMFIKVIKTLNVKPGTLLEEWK